MTRIEKSIEINVPPEKVWPMIQWDRMLEWYTAFNTIEWTSKDNHKKGATVHVTAELAGFKSETDYETVEYVENEKYTVRSTGGSFKATGIRALSPTKNGTKVTIIDDYKPSYSILGWILDKLWFRRAFEKSIETGFNNLKVMLEK